MVVAALATEYLDGAISRRFRMESRIGQIMDPVADKIFYASVMRRLIREGSVGRAKAMLLGSRDIAVLLGVALALVRKRWSQIGQMKPTYLGKIATVFQYGVFFDLLARSKVQPKLMNAAIVLSGAAALQYFLLELSRSDQLGLKLAR